MVLDMQSDPTSTRRFKAMSPDDVIFKLDEIMDEQAILKLQQLGTAAPDPVSALGMDKSSFCKLAALKYNNNYNNAEEEEFHAPVVTFPPTTTSIIVTTYFNSRVDPLRCYKHPLGHMAGDNWAYLEHWWISVFRSGLSAIIFHESLSEVFTAKLTTDKIKFQKVTLSHHTWSLCDERWAVYSKWLTSPAAQYIEYTLQMDLSDTVVARDPFSLFEQGLDIAGAVQSERDDESRGFVGNLEVERSSSIQNQQQHIKDQGNVRGGNQNEGGGDSHRQRHPDLWVNVQRATDWIQTNYNECYGTNNTALLPGGTKGMAYNAGVVGGRKAAFLDLANAIVAEFDEMYSHSEKVIWNCDMSALHKTLTSQKFLNKHSVFAGGHPFCAGGVKCWGHGVCDYRIYHK